MDSDLIFALSVALFSGRVLHAKDVTAGNGEVIDWRTVKSGDTVVSHADAYDVAVVFAATAGWKAAAIALDGGE